MNGATSTPAPISTSASTPRSGAEPASAGWLSITFNRRAERVAVGLTVQDLVARLALPPEAIATAVNGIFLPRAARRGRVLREGDSVIAFQPIAGG